MSTTVRIEAPPARSAPAPSDAAPAPTQTPIRTRCPMRRENLTVHELDGEALIFDPRTADTHRLNGTALFIWRRFDGRANIESIARQVSEQYDVSTEEARAHVEALVAALGEKGLLDLARLGPGCQ